MEHIDIDDVLASPHRQPYEALLQIDRYIEGTGFDPDSGLYKLLREIRVEETFTQTMSRNVSIYPRRSRKGATPSRRKVLSLFDALAGKTFIASEAVTQPGKGILVELGKPIAWEIIEEIREHNLKCVDDPNLTPLTHLSVLDIATEEEARVLQDILDSLAAVKTGAANGKNKAKLDPALLERDVSISFQCKGYALKFPWRDKEPAEYTARLKEYERECRWRGRSLRVGVYGRFEMSRAVLLKYGERSFPVPFQPEKRDLPIGFFPLFSSTDTLIWDNIERVPILQLIDRNDLAGENLPEEIGAGLESREVRTFADHVKRIVVLQIRKTNHSLRQKVRTHPGLSTVDLETAQPLTKAFDHLLKGESCRVLNDLNPLAEISQKREITLRGPGGVAGSHPKWPQRGVHWSHCGRICLTETPESIHIGLNLHLALAAKIGGSMLLAPYRAPVDNDGPQETLWLGPEEERSETIAPKRFENPRVGENTLVRKNGMEITMEDPSLISLEEKYHGQFLGIGANLIPFVHHNDNNRVMMGAKNMKQALPLKTPEAPIVSTGREEIAARLSGHCVYAASDGIVGRVDGKEIVLSTDDDAEESYSLESGRPTLYRSQVFHRPVVKEGQEVKRGDLMADGAATCNGKLALGVNLLVAYMSYEGLNFEDGIVASDRLVREDVLTSLHMSCQRFEILDGEFTRVSQSWGSQHEVRKDKALFSVLALDGVFCKEGIEVHKGDILFGKVCRENGKWTSRYCRSTVDGKVVKVLHHDVDLTVGSDDPNGLTEAGKHHRPGVRCLKSCWIQYEHRLEAGDKLMGRHGNKGVVSRIIPEKEMPCLPDGTYVDLVLNPHGVVSRMNLGQLLETHWSWVVSKGNGAFDRYATVMPFETFPPEDLKTAFRKLSDMGVDANGKFQLHRVCDGQVEYFNNPIVVGYQYFMKLNHLAENKIHARETGPYSLTVNQPVKGKRAGGGQRFGEMEVWALESHSCPHLLRELMTVRSDASSFRDVPLVAEYWREEMPIQDTVPFTETFYAAALLLRGLCLDLVFVDSEENEISILDWKAGRMKAEIVKARIRFADPGTIAGWAGGRSVSRPGLPRYEAKEWKYPKDGMFDPVIFSAPSHPNATPGRENMGYIELEIPVVNPLWLDSIENQILESLKKPEIAESIVRRPRTTAMFHCHPDVCVKECPDRSLARCMMTTIQSKTVQDDMGKVLLVRDFFYSCKCGELRGLMEHKSGLACPKCSGMVERKTTSDSCIALPVLTGVDYLQDLADRGIVTLGRGAILTHIPVLPTDFRPFKAKTGNAVYASALNDFYKSILQINETIRNVERSSPEDAGMARNADLSPANDGETGGDAKKSGRKVEHDARFRMRRLLLLRAAMQRAVNRLMVGTDKVDAKNRKSLAEHIDGKYGILRLHLLGKRVDVSARSVIVPDPDLEPDEISVPYRMLQSLLGSRIQEELLERISPKKDTPDGKAVEQSAEPERYTKMLRDILDPGNDKGFLNGTNVILNRSPSLHKYSVLSFKPVPKDRKALGLHPLACGFFNADFDGDTMALYVPLFEKSHREAEEKLLLTRNVLSLANGDILYHFDQDIVLGIFVHTSTDAGRNEFNEWFKDAGIDPVTGPVTKKMLKAHVLRYHLAVKDFRKTSEIAQKIMQVGFREATRSGLSLGIFDIPDARGTPEAMTQSTLSDEAIQPATADGHEILQADFAEMPLSMTDAEARLKEWLAVYGEPGADGVKGSMVNPLALMARSGAKGNMKQIVQLGTMRGQLQDIMGKNVGSEVRSSFLSGVSPLEYYLGSHAGRRTMCEKKLAVAPAGHLTRTLVEASYPLVIRTDDCQTKEGLTFFPFPDLPLDDGNWKSLPSMNKRLLGRTILSGDPSMGDSAKVRSVLTCEADKEHGYGAVCRKCYGWDLSRMEYPDIGSPVGLWASQSIGERGTQLTMRTFHTGGGGGEGAITDGLDYMSGMFACLKVLPSYFRVLGSSNGKRAKDKVMNTWKILCSLGLEARLPFLRKHEDSDRVKRVEMSLPQVLKRWGIEGLRTILAFEGYRIYDNAIDERHFEVILKAMLLSKGDELLPIQQVPFFHLKKRSFLAQASFQNAIEVLTEAALEEGEDHLELDKARIMLGALFNNRRDHEDAAN